jgi:TatD DNase family protein
MLEFVDTHCHIHDKKYYDNPKKILGNAKAAGVNKLICIGTDHQDSRHAVKFAESNKGIWASVGIIPHDAKLGQAALNKLEPLIQKPKVVAIGECGLDFYYSHSLKQDQVKALNFQIELAQKHSLPLIFHVRDAYDDFWPIFDKYKNIKAVLHSFSAGREVLDKALERGLFIGLNGIVTFTKDIRQLETFKAVPLDSLLLETDAPYLTPVPLRGKVNESKNVVLVADFLSNLRSETLEQLARVTTANAAKLFGI